MSLKHEQTKNAQQCAKKQQNIWETNCVKKQKIADVKKIAPLCRHSWPRNHVLTRSIDSTASLQPRYVSPGGGVTHIFHGNRFNTSYQVPENVHDDGLRDVIRIMSSNYLVDPQLNDTYCRHPHKCCNLTCIAPRSKACLLNTPQNVQLFFRPTCKKSYFWGR